MKIIAEMPSSPIEIAEKLNTTVSYISQQLKLLEVANLVVKTKTGFAEKGKPRNLYDISSEFLYLASLTKQGSSKKLLHLTEYHKSILNIWLLDDTSLHYPIEKLFWKLDENLGEIEGIFLERGFVPKILVVSGSKEVKNTIDSFVKKFDKKISYSFIQKSSLSKVSIEALISLYDPNDFLGELKGGKILDE